MPRYKYSDETREANIIPVCQENAAVTFQRHFPANTELLLFREDTAEPPHEAYALFTHKQCSLQNKHTQLRCIKR